MKSILLCILALLTSVTARSQLIINGKVSDEDGPVSGANIIIREGDVIRQFTTSATDGAFRIKVNTTASAYLEVSDLQHETIVISLADHPPQNGVVKLDIHLTKRVTQLQEIQVGPPPALRQAQDTLEYNPERFRDGSERVVEDLLAKLPGIKIEANGEIKYKGKSIKKMLLDGDDLFDTNYTAGSRNISADMIEKVQGIDHYEENSLLKGIRDSDDVALNLVLKKGKTDVSGNAALGYGWEDRYQGELSGLAVNRRIKGFGIASYNNIGVNNSPYEFNSEIISLDQLANRDTEAKDVISEGDFGSLLDPQFHRENRNFYTSLYALHKVLRRSSLKWSAGFYRDRLFRTATQDTRITLPNDIFSVHQADTIYKRPQLLDLGMQLVNKENERFHWEYKGKVNVSEVAYNNESNNNGTLQSGAVQSEKRNMRQQLATTYKISDTEALVSDASFSLSDHPQTLYTNPGTLVDTSSLLAASDQDSRFQKQVLALRASYFGNAGNYKWALHARHDDIRNRLTSTLRDTDGSFVGDDFRNDMTFNARSTSLTPKVAFSWKRYTLRTGLTIAYNDLRLTSPEIREAAGSFCVMPQLTALFDLNNLSNLSFTYRYDQAIPSEDHQFSGIIQTDYRGFLSNLPSLRYLKAHTYQLGYSYNNLFEMSRFNVSLGHTFRPANFYYDHVIRQDISISRSFFAHVPQRSYTLSTSAENYLHTLRTTFQFDGSGTLGFLNNVVNGSEIRRIRNESFLLELTAKRTIGKRIFSETKTSYRNSSYTADGSPRLSMSTLTQRTKITFRHRNTFTSSVIANYICTSLDRGPTYLFLDTELNWTPLKNGPSYALTAKNLVGHSHFLTRNVSDYAVTESAHNLIGRYVMVKMTWRF